MEFQEYQHIVKLDDPEVEGLLVGKCYIFPKIDGTNASLWLDPTSASGNSGIIRGGSRHRTLEVSKDNAGFYNDVIDNHLNKYASFFTEHPNLRLYGEWLVPHTLKTYRDDAWRKFYVFDVTMYDKDADAEIYLTYETYKAKLDEFGIDYIPALRIITDPTHEDLTRTTDINTYLLKEDLGVGEGVVIKNYCFVNKYGRMKWGKIVRNDFKDKHYKDMGAPERTNNLLEKELVDRFMDRSLVDKIYSIILRENDISTHNTTGESFQKKWIPRLLEQSYHDFVTEEIWVMVKYVQKEKLRGIDFKNLKQHSLNKVKQFYPELFRRGLNE